MKVVLSGMALTVLKNVMKFARWNVKMEFVTLEPGKESNLILFELFKAR